MVKVPEKKPQPAAARPVNSPGGDGSQRKRGRQRGKSESRGSAPARARPAGVEVDDADLDDLDALLLIGD
jgi:hypothetical protein